MSEILALIKCIPMLVSILQEAGKFIKQTFGDNPEKFLTDAHQAFKLLNEAKSSDDRIEAAKKLQGLLKRL